MSEKRINKRIKIDKENTIKISKKLEGNIILASLIDQAGVRYEKLEEYINPKYEDLFDPYLFKDMEKAVDRILEAMNKNEKISIFGDYDADGNTALAVILNFFKYINYKNVEYILPNRLIDGYGMNLEKVKEIKKNKVDLVITVDCGIKNNEEIEELNKLNIDTIITDHHEQGEHLPNAYSIINPKVKGEKYPYKDLSGSGVAFKLITAINEKLEDKKKISKDEIYQLMLIAIIGTIGDVMPLNGENRDMIKLAINNINKENMLPGLKVLINNFNNLNEQDIAYYIVPKINSSGRMGEDIALSLLIEEDELEARKKGEELEKLNYKRKEETEKAFSEIEKIIQKDKLYEYEYILAGKENLHEGIIGIVAAKVSEKYKKPALIYTDKNKNEFVGSSRCVNQDVNIYDILEDLSENFIAFGGHDFAAGLSFEKSKEQEIHEIFKSLKIEKLDKINEYNNELNLNEASIELLKSMEILRPYGNKNKEPKFLFRNLKVKNIMERPNFTKITFSQAVGYGTNTLTNKKEVIEKEIECISFKTLDKLNINKNGLNNIFATLNLNTFRGNETLQLMI